MEELVFFADAGFERADRRIDEQKRLVPILHRWCCSWWNFCC